MVAEASGELEASINEENWGKQTRHLSHVEIRKQARYQITQVVHSQLEAVFSQGSLQVMVLNPLQVLLPDLPAEDLFLLQSCTTPATWLWVETPRTHTHCTSRTIKYSTAGGSWFKPELSSRTQVRCWESMALELRTGSWLAKTAHLSRYRTCQHMEYLKPDTRTVLDFQFPPNPLCEQAKSWS